MFGGMGGAWAPQNAMATTFGQAWYKDPGLRRYFARVAAAYRANAGVVRAGSKKLRVYPFGVRMQMESKDFDKALDRLPLAMAARIQRKGLKKGLMIWRDAVRTAFSAHRSPLLRPHLAENVAAHSRVYKRGRNGRLVWGAVGVRWGGATESQKVKALKEAKKTGRTKVGAHFNELPGWRVHFIVTGNNSFKGRRYFELVMNTTKNQVQEAIAFEISQQIREFNRR